MNAKTGLVAGMCEIRVDISDSCHFVACPYSRLVGVCHWPGHGRCVKERAAHGGNAKAQGRPWAS